MTTRLLQLGITRPESHDRLLDVGRHLGALRDQLEHAVLLTTCERAELYAITDLTPDEIDHDGLEARWNDDATRHLFRVAAGLESRILGEPHVLGQIARAFKQARHDGLDHPALLTLFTDALRAGRAVRHRTTLGRAASSCVTLATDQLFRDGIPDRLVVLGTGTVAHELAARAHAHGVTRIDIVSRHRQRAADLAERVHGAHPAHIDDLPTLLIEADALVTATTTHTPIVTAAHLDARTRQASATPLRVIDLGVPPNTAPDLAAHHAIDRRHLDELTPDRKPSLEAVRDAEALIDDALRSHDARTASTPSVTSIVLAAHGAGAESPANQRILRIAELLEQQLADTPVTPAFRMGAPAIGEALSNDDAPLLLPLMTSDGFFARSTLQREATHSNPHATLTPSAGAEYGVQRWYVEQLHEIVRHHRREHPDTAVVIVGHGTRRQPERSAAATEAVAALLRAHDHALDVRTAYLDQDPDIQPTVAGLRASHTVIAPFLVGGGGHELEDIPERAIAGANGRRLTILPAFGADEPAIAHLLARLTTTTAPWIRLGTRASRLAIWQAERVAEALTRAGAFVILTPIVTIGDRHITRPIEAFAEDAPFCDDLERALLDGTIDAAVHSLKDLPLEPTPGLLTAACLPRGSTHETLVTANGVTLDNLPAGARIGTSSARRTRQLLALRSDLTPVPIRGAVDSRVRQVDDGRFDGALLAEAGLERLGLAHRIAQRLPGIIPEAGQGAIAIQTRLDDHETHDLLESVHHAPTGRAVEAERIAARILESHGLIGSAIATGESRLHLHVRAIDPQRDRTVDVRVTGTNPKTTGTHAADRALALLAAGVDR